MSSSLRLPRKDRNSAPTKRSPRYRKQNTLSCRGCCRRGIGSCCPFHFRPTPRAAPVLRNRERRERPSKDRRDGVTNTFRLMERWPGSGCSQPGQKNHPGWIHDDMSCISATLVTDIMPEICVILNTLRSRKDV